MTKRTFIDTESDNPIFQQIVDEIERQILLGDLKENDFLPSVRELAVSQTVNPNTVAKAYLQLQALGLVESVRGKGLIVKNMKSKDMALRRHSIMEKHIRLLIETADSLAVPLEDVIKKLQSVWRKR